MSVIQQNSLIDSRQSKLINELLQKLNDEQKLWLGGYLTGLNESTRDFLNILNEAGKQILIGPAMASPGGPRLSILYGTRSGNAQKVAQMAYSMAESKGIQVQLVNLNDYNPKDIKKELYALVIVSTDGEGEPPVSTEEFYHYIMGKKAPVLEHLRYSVLALGDSSYQHFCKIGRDIDARLLELGAKQLSPRVDCDVDFTDKSNEWATKGVNSFLETVSSQTPHVTVQHGTTNKISYGPKNPYQAAVLERINLNGRGSTKRTWHIELSLEESDITYRPGDALGVVCHNQETLVDEFLSVTGFDPESAVKTDSGDESLRNSLIFNYELSTLTPQVVESYALLVKNNDLIRLTEDKDELFKFTYSKDIVDLVREYPAKADMDEFLAIMRKIRPRLYSIASSYQANPDEVHLTVGEVEYFYGKRKHQGVCSSMLSGLPDDKKVPVYVDENISFRLPEDPAVPIIMIGAGTGVAPYRAFLQERELYSSGGKSWLFFGERNFTLDFLYQTEWQKYLKNKVLTRMDVAFSRDQDSKIYVQDKLMANSKELFAWIEEGAHIYLCGDKNNMARDVKLALQQIIAAETRSTEEKAIEYFRQLRKQNRFHEDVY